MAKKQSKSVVPPKRARKGKKIVSHTPVHHDRDDDDLPGDEGDREHEGTYGSSRKPLRPAHSSD